VSLRFDWHSIDDKRTEGRAVMAGERWSLRAAWNLWSHFCGVEVERDDEGGWTLMLAFPPVAIWLTFSLGFHGSDEREVSLRVHDWALWWRFWTDPNSWSRETPRWRDGSWHPLDTFLGRVRYESVDLSTHAVVIPMPEGVYPATASVQRCTWKRPRWFARVREYVKVDIDRRGGIPHEGKGENAWDCGTDGLCGYSTEGSDLAAAVADGVRRMLRYRRKYDGNMWAKYEAPRASPSGEGAAKGGEG
jgi:hypothetical protein